MKINISYKAPNLPFALTQKRNFELSGLFVSCPVNALIILDCFFNVIVFVFAESPYVLITQGW